MKKGKLTALFLGAAISIASLSSCAPYHNGESLTKAHNAPPHKETTLADHDRKTITAICQSSAPLLIIDLFNASKPDYGDRTSKNTIDIDGDNISDIDHGDMVKKVAELSGKKVITYGLKYTPLNHIDMQSITDALADIIDLIKNNKMKKPAAISISMGTAYSFEKLEKQLQKDLGLTAENIGDKRFEVVREMKKSPLIFKEIKILYKRFSTLKQMGIPVISAAGNDYSRNTINLHNISGAISIGALTYNGKTVAPYSNQNSLTRIYRVGDFISRRVKGGIDINNDGKADFLTKNLSGKMTIATLFNGIPANTYKTPLIYDNESFIVQAYMLSGSDKENAKKDSEIYGEFFHLQSGLAFRKNAAGNLVFDPANDGDPTQVTINMGTSFAAPNICGK